MINEIDQDDRVIDHHSGQGHQAKHAEHGQWQAAQGMSPNGPHKTERNDHQDEQRLKVGAKFNRQQHKHRQQSDTKTQEEAPQRLLALLALPLPADLNFVAERLLAKQFRHKVGGQLTDDPIGIAAIFQDVGSDCNTAQLVHTVDLGKTPLHINGGQFR